MNQTSEKPTSPTPATATGKPGETSNWPYIVRLLGIAAGVVVLVYGVWWGVLYTMQDKMIFPVDKLPMPVRQPRFANTLVLSLQLENGGTNEAWLIPGRGVDNQNPGPLVIFFHGNMELIDFQDQIVSEYTRRGISVLLPEYRGYGRSGGTPGRDAIEEDNEQFFDTVIKLPTVDPTRVVMHGRSIGGAICAELAAHRKPAGLILESTMASMAQMAWDRAAPAFLIKHPYVTDQVISKLKCPTLIMHGSADDVIPVEHGHMLQQANPNATYVEYDAGHNDFPGTNNLQAYWSQIDKLLREVGIDPAIRPAPKAVKLETISPQQPAATSTPAPAPTAPATEPVPAK